MKRRKKITNSLNSATVTRDHALRMVSFFSQSNEHMSRVIAENRAYIWLGEYHCE